LTGDFDAALAAGDVDAVVAGLQSLGEADRRRLAPRALAWFTELKRNTIAVITTGQWPYTSDSDTLLKAARAMVLGTATLAELRKLGAWAAPDEAIAYRVVADRRPEWLPEWAAMTLENQTTSWGTPFALVRRLIAEGLVPRPSTPWYPLSMIYGLQRRDRDVYEALKADPALLDDEVWRLFEVEGGGDTSLAAHDKYCGERQSWTWALLQLSRDGLLPHDRLLDASLEALRRDFGAFRAGWFSRFHEAMRPSPDERAARTDRYLTLLHSPIPATVSFAVKALRRAGPLPASAVEPLSAALRSSAGSVVREVLELLLPSSRSAQLAAGYLPHRSIEIQTALLGFIEKCPPDPAVRESLARAGSGLAPSLSVRVATILGAQPARMAATAHSPTASLAPREVSVSDPVESVPDLVELLAELLEKIDDPHDIERALDGVARFCKRAPETASRLGPIAKRAGKLLEGRVPSPFAGVSVRSDLAGLITAWATGAVAPVALKHRSLLAFLSGRVQEVAARAARNEPGVLLSLPTGRGGTLAADALEARRQQAREMGCRPDPLDEIQAELRTRQSSESTPSHRFVYGASGEAHVSFELRPDPRVAREPAPTDVPALFYAAVEGGGSPWARPFDYCAAMGERTRELSEAIRWVATVWPSNREPFYARGALELGGNIDWWQARWYTRSFLEPLLLPTEPVGEMATLLLSLGLAAREAGERGLATDVAIAAIADGRLDLERTGKIIGDLTNSRLLKGTRLASALADASRMSSQHVTSVCELIEVVLSALDGPPPSDLHALLSLLNELQASLDHGIRRPTARAYLVGIEGTGKAATLARHLLARS
jgi:Family of unknown function (DUF6493)